MVKFKLQIRYKNVKFVINDQNTFTKKIRICTLKLIKKINNKNTAMLVMFDYSHLFYELKFKNKKILLNQINEINHIN